MSDSTRRTLEALLRLGFATAALALAARALFGPLTIPVPVRSPINAEGWLAIAAAALLALRLRPAPNAAIEEARSVRDLWMPVSLAVLILVVFWNSRGDYFLADDFLLLRYAREFVFDLHRLMTTPGGDGFFRPVGHVFFGLLYRWAEFDPLRWHLAGFAMHAVNTALVFAVLRQMKLAQAAAWFASALFAVHATRPETVVWTGGRFDLLATFFVLAELALFLAFLDSKSSWRWLLLILSIAAAILGIFSKESAYAGPPILALVMWAREGRIARKLIATVAPFFAVAAGLFAYRWVLFGSIGGYLDASGRPQALGVTPLNALKALAFRIWAVLVFPIDWSWSPGLLLGAAMVLYLAALAWMTTSRVPWRAVVAPLAFVLLASLPPLQQLLIGPDMEKARYLYLPAVGFCWLLAVILHEMKPRPRKFVAAAILLFNLAAIGNNLSAWHFASRQARSACVAAAACAREGNHSVLAVGLPRTILGVPLFAFGFEDCTSMLADGAPVSVRQADVLQSGDSTSQACLLQWDPASSQLRRIR